jgi:hypothetical protein
VADGVGDPDGPPVPAAETLAMVVAVVVAPPLTSVIVIVTVYVPLLAKVWVSLTDHAVLVVGGVVFLGTAVATPVCCVGAGWAGAACC